MQIRDGRSDEIDKIPIVQCHYVELSILQPLKIFVALHVFPVLIIFSHDKLWGLPRRVFTLFDFSDKISLDNVLLLMAIFCEFGRT